MSAENWQRYIDNGTRLVEAHPDLHDGGIDFYTAAKDSIGDILHAARERVEDDFDPQALLDEALRGYRSDFEDRPSVDADTLQEAADDLETFADVDGGDNIDVAAMRSRATRLRELAESIRTGGQS